MAIFSKLIGLIYKISSKIATFCDIHLFNIIFLKVVKKIEPDEKVGVICKVEDRFQVVEYSEISEVTRNLRDKENDLLYNAGNICNHFLNTEFLNQLCR